MAGIPKRQAINGLGRAGACWHGTWSKGIMKTTLKTIRIAAGSAALLLVASLSANAAVSSDVATRPSGNVPVATIPVKDGGTTERGTMDKAKYDTKSQSNKSSQGSASDSLTNSELKPAGGSMTGGSPDNEGTKSPSPRK